MALSLLLDKKSNYNLEALFTIDEEQGLTGARNVEPKVLKSKYLINLDSEDDDEIVVGSAGGKRSEICYRTKREENDKIQYLLRIFDGVSGHSGVMIQESRSNVIVDAFVMLKTLSEKVEFNLVSAESGRADNVIPPYINIVLSIEDLGLFKKEFKTLFAEYKKAYEAFEPNLNYEIKKVAKPSFKPLSNACSQSFLNLMSLANNGINGYDFKTNMPTLSTNIGVIATTEKTINVS
jgi:dipeptidase D